MFGNSSYQVAGTNTLVNAAINKLKGTGLPSNLDTLLKLATAINLNPTFAGDLYDGVISDLDTLNKIANSINDDDDFYGSMLGLLSTKVDTTATALWQKYKLTESTGDALTPGVYDYNSITNPGIYGLGDGSSVTMSHAPSDFASAAKAILKIDKYTGTGDMSQTLIDLSTMITYTRTYYSSWQAWVTVVDLNVASTWQQFKLTENTGEAQNSSETDYDNLTTAGVFGLPNGSSLSHAPSGFSSSTHGIICVSSYASRLFQYLIDTSNGTVFTRVYDSSSWSTWV
ncbi:MAG: hypothetical protein IT247_01195 [Bacteroidia bacterium]|nr:hypothetical protein [Bacteroidia bacterium]